MFPMGSSIVLQFPELDPGAQLQVHEVVGEVHSSSKTRAAGLSLCRAGRGYASSIAGGRPRGSAFLP